MPPRDDRATGRDDFAQLVGAIREALATVPPRNGFSVADLCRRWKVGPDKVHAFRRRGELVGVNVATSTSARAQWRFPAEAVAAFERRRTSAPIPKPNRRRRAAEQTDFFPN